MAPVGNAGSDSQFDRGTLFHDRDGETLGEWWESIWLGLLHIWRYSIVPGTRMIAVRSSTQL